MSSIDFKTLSTQVEKAIIKGEGSKLNINIYKEVNDKKINYFRFNRKFEIESI